MRLKKSPPSATPTQSPTSSPPNTLRKARTEHPQRAYATSNASRSPSASATGDMEAEGSSNSLSLSSLLPEASPASVTSTISTFKGWPISRSLPSFASRYPNSAPTSNEDSDGPAAIPDSASSPIRSPSPTLPSTASTSSTSNTSAYSVTVAAPTVYDPSTHPFLPKRPYSVPMCANSNTNIGHPTLASAFQNPHPFNDTPHRRVNISDMGTVALDSDTIMGGVPCESSAASSSSAGGNWVHLISTQDSASSVGSDRSVLHAVTIISEPEKYSLCIKLPGFDLSNLLISARRDRSLLIAANKFEDEPDTVRRGGGGGSTSYEMASVATTSSGRFERLIRFGPDAQPSRASARFDGERLTVTVPKAALSGWGHVDCARSTPGAPLPEVERSPRSIAMSLKHHSDNVGRGTEDGQWSEDRMRCSSSAGSVRSSCDGSTLEDSSVYSPQTNMSDEDAEEARLSCAGASGSGCGGDTAARAKAQTRATTDAMAGLSFSPGGAAVSSPLPPSPTLSIKRPRSTSSDCIHQDVAAHYSNRASSSAPIRRSSRSPPVQKQHHYNHHHHHGHGMGHVPTPRRDLLGLSKVDDGFRECDDELETPTPWRVAKERDGGGDAGDAIAATNLMSPKKDYFGFTLSSSSNSSSTSTIQQHSPESSRKASLLPPTEVSMDVDVDETMIIRPPLLPASAPPAASAVRTREQGMGRSAFFWKRWAGASSTAC
ncbi:hypothetical protein FRB97_007605 [Tulasnella sp. 331]|nr:hypothetical protein FRB97_007605 [Tulasnella sp. 331]